MYFSSLSRVADEGGLRMPRRKEGRISGQMKWSTISYTANLTKKKTAKCLFGKKTFGDWQNHFGSVKAPKSNHSGLGGKWRMMK